MASQTTDPTTAGPERIAFEVERVEQSDSGPVEVHGRWFGIRGRRFVRPALTLKIDGAEQRYLADLEQKPWAAEEGEDWLAVFPVEVKLGQVADIELSVAPDITVRLSDGRQAATPRRRRSTAAILRAPRVRTDADAPRPALTERAREIDRLNARLIAAGQALERERTVRTATGQQLEREHARLAAADQELERERARRRAVIEELEEERAEALRLRAQVGKLQAELDLARAAQVDSTTTEAQLDDVRRALDEERSGAKRLRSQLAEAREAMARARESAARATESAARPRGSARSERAARGARAPESVKPSPVEEASPVEKRSPVEKTSRVEKAAQVESAPASGQGPGAQSHDGPVHAEQPDPTRQFVPLQRPDRGARSSSTPAATRGQPPPRPDRPLNPSLRHGTYWLIRLLVVLVMIAVVAAIILVIKSTVSL
jgi:hypothetical protein